jgi:hypothetical protein
MDCYDKKEIHRIVQDAVCFIILVGFLLVVFAANSDKKPKPLESNPVVITKPAPMINTIVLQSSSKDPYFGRVVAIGFDPNDENLRKTYLLNKKILKTVPNCNVFFVKE